MRIIDQIGRGAPVFSFEFFPPKTPQGEETLYRTIERLKPLAPTFVSVTYGAGGSTRAKTVELVTRIKHQLGIETMAHITCVGADREEIANVLDELQQNGIENVLPLRGDPPRDQTQFVKPLNGFGFARELVEFIRARAYGFCLAGACYPEGHVECRDLELDLAHLKAKVEAGLDFAITQLFFNNADYFAFEERSRKAGIGVPLIAGIMPITNFAQIERFTSMCGAAIPAQLRQRLAAAGDDEAKVREIGIDHAVEQCEELLRRGVPGIHFYTLNQSMATRAILERLRGAL